MGVCRSALVASSETHTRISSARSPASTREATKLRARPTERGLRANIRACVVMVLTSFRVISSCGP